MTKPSVVEVFLDFNQSRTESCLLSAVGCKQDYQQEDLLSKCKRIPPICVCDYSVDDICVRDILPKTSNMLNKIFSAFKQGASKQTPQQSSLLVFVYAKDKWRQSGGFSGHSANIACFKSFSESI